MSILSERITLVDLDGGPVPIWEKDAPIVPAFDPDEESDPASWPAAYDNHFWEPGAELGLDDEEDVFGPIGPLPDLRDPHDWPAEGPDGPDGDPAIAFPGIAPLAERMALAPICGGSEDAEPFTPSEADWEDYRAWAAEIEARASLARMCDPLYGYE